MSAENQPVPRRLKKAEFTIVFATRQAQTGWRDVVATQRNAVFDAWEFPTRHPMESTPTNYRLKGELAVVQRDGSPDDRWQHRLSGGLESGLRPGPSRSRRRRPHSSPQRTK